MAWSKIKVAIAAGILDDAGGPNGLSRAEQNQIERALTASDNGAADRLFERLGSTPTAAAKVTTMLREAGDDTTVVSAKARGSFSPYGQTDWSLVGQQRFMAALAGGCLATEVSTRYLLDLMGGVTSDRWGLGSVGIPARWKGGWGPDVDDGYVVRQMGLIESEAGPVVVTLAARPSDGQFATGQRMASRVANWLGEHADRYADRALDCR